MKHDTLIRYGGAVKVLEKKGDLVTVGGLSVIYDDPAAPVKDLTGEYFTPETYFGARKGDGADVLFHHGLPVGGFTKARELADYIFPAAKTQDDEMGLLSSVVLDLRKDYEAFAYEKSVEGALGWSTGSAGHMVRKSADGQITRWPIIEVSLTPTPAEPRTSAVPLKSLITSPSAFKAESLTAQLDRIHRAFYGQWDRGWVAEIFDAYVIAEVDGDFYQIAYTSGEEGIQFAPWQEWQRVERRVEWEPMKAIHEAVIKNMQDLPAGTSSLDDLALAMKIQNLNTITKLRGI